MTAPLLLLGPQRPEPNLPEALATLPGGGSVVAITAGWRHDEGETEALFTDLGGAAVHLPLYAWFEEIQGAAPELARVYRARQAHIGRIKELYQQRLKPAMDTVRAMAAAAREEPAVAEPELEDALAAVRSLDAHFLARADAVHARFEDRLRALVTPLVAQRRAEAASAVAGARAVMIAGGHVAVLRNRLIFFDLDRALPAAQARGVPIVAWSAGAMALSERIVLFYDDPPDGSADPEVFDRGLGLARGLVLLPHARRRLRLGDAERVSLLARRFAPHPCVGLENGAWLERHPGASTPGRTGWVRRGDVGAALVLDAAPAVEAADAGDP